ncbi:MAG: bifunctional folylpolyglutamate synthase/dihydrofolate synthase [Ilumatobacteraceae bacterium]|nr:bifunctional folylpolyglutamate synthase/dihydrofolate synthase [Actinomycetota bacterium]
MSLTPIERAREFLESHSVYEKTGRIESPSLANIERLMQLLGEPQRAYRTIHITGTNGKGSTSQMVTKLLMAHGLTVGTYTSPHLERVNERMMRNGLPIDDDEFAENVLAIAELEPLVGRRISYFEILTAVAFRWFADSAIDVGVIEVGLLGRWDATNVVESDVAVLTNISLDHTEFAGPTHAHIAREKVGIVKSNSVFVQGETRPDVQEILAAAPCAKRVVRDEHFEVLENELAVGGRLVSVRTTRAEHRELFVPLHGRHQGDNAATAIVAVEEFFDHAISRDVLDEGMATVSMPGRFEVMGHQPLVIVDGAHNVGGAEVCAEVFFDDFKVDGRRVLVVGMLKSRNPEELLGALRADDFDLVVCCTAPTPRGTPASELMKVAQAMGCDDVQSFDKVDAALSYAYRGLRAEDALLVAGSLYVVGEARPVLRTIIA